MKKFFTLFTTILLGIGVLPGIGHAQDTADACLTHVPQFDTTVRIGRGLIDDVALSPDGVRLAVASGSGVWIYEAGTLADVALLDAGVSPATVAWSPDGKRLAAGYADGVRIWEVNAGEVEQHWPEWPEVTHVAWSPDGARLAIINLAEVSQFPDATPYFDIRVLEIDTGRQSLIASRVIRNPEQAVWSPDGQKLLYVLSYAYEADSDLMDWVPAIGAAALWDVPTETSTTLTPTDPNGYYHVKEVAWSPDGSTWAMAVTERENDPNHVALVDAVTGSPIKRVPVAGEQLQWSGSTLGMVVDLNVVLVGGDDRHELEMPANINQFAISPDASRLIVASSLDIRLIDTASDQVLATITPHNGYTFFPAWSADGQMVALGQRASLTSERVIAVFKIDGTPVTSFAIESTPRVMAWSPDGRQIAVAWGRGMAVQNLADGSRLTLDAVAVWGLAWSPDGRQLAYLTDAGDVTLYDLDSGTSQTFASPIADLDGTAVNLDSRLAWTAAGLRWVLGDWDEVYRVFGPDFATGQTVQLAEIGVLEAIILGTSPEFLADGNLIYVPYEGDMTLFDMAAGAVQATYPVVVDEVRWSAGGGCFGWTGGPAALLYDTVNGEQLNAIQLPVTPEWGLYGGTFWSPTGTHVLIPLSDGTALIWGSGDDGG